MKIAHFRLYEKFHPIIVYIFFISGKKNCSTIRTTLKNRWYFYNYQIIPNSWLLGQASSPWKENWKLKILLQFSLDAKKRIIARPKEYLKKILDHSPRTNATGLKSTIYCQTRILLYVLKQIWHRLPVVH